MLRSATFSVTGRSPPISDLWPFSLNFPAAHCTSRNAGDQLVQHRTPALMETLVHYFFWAFVRVVSILLRLCGPVPQHMAFIMDGNRRFASTHGREAQLGHRDGYSKARLASNMYLSSTHLLGNRVCAPRLPGCAAMHVRCCDAPLQRQGGCCLCICIADLHIECVRTDGRGHQMVHGAWRRDHQCIRVQHRELQTQ